MLSRGHPDDEKGSHSQRHPLGKIDDITNSLEEEEEDHDDIEDKRGGGRKAENKDRQTEQDQAETDSDEAWEDEKFKRKGWIQKGSHMLLLIVLTFY